MSRKNLSLKKIIALLDKVKSLPPGTSQRKIAKKLWVLKSTVVKLLKEEVILRENTIQLKLAIKNVNEKGKISKLTRP